ncbi:hypothetical protein MKX03_018006 [Papaver bracteatum]|nr:hypothetical protein MKX03_018006 [Papaver bracteatum]
MSLTGGRSPGFFAIIICLFGMVSAWKPTCIPGDIYLDSTGFPPLPPGTTCSFCDDWCDAQCSNLGLPPVKYGCRLQDDIRCSCCCSSSPSSPGSPPSPALPPPAPEDPSQFDGMAPNSYNICTAGQEYIAIKRDTETECIDQPICEQECEKKGLSMVRKECVSYGESWPNPSNRWYEQCCCGKLPPPPPPPPPCPCGNTCDLDVNVQISVSTGQEPRSYKLSQSS